jgi:hypothetical protein
MAKKKKTPAAMWLESPSAHWVIETEIQIHGRHVVKDTELSIIGERGRFRFLKQITNGDKTWIDVVGGPKGAKQMRSFHLDKVRRVHYKNKTREGRKAQGLDVE